MNRLSRSLNCAALGASVLIFSAASASAAIVCGCKAGWHAHEYRHPGKPVLVFHADDWRWGRTDQYQWRREHGVRGYLRGNKLIGDRDPPSR